MRLGYSHLVRSTISLIILALVTALIGVSCSRDNTDPANPKAEAGQDNTSRFLAEVGKTKYEQVSPPSTDPVFRWDFSNSKDVHTYAYEQEVRSKTNMGSALNDKVSGMKQEISAKGLMQVKSQGDSTAELVLKGVKMNMTMDIGKEDPKKMEQEMPPLVMQGMKEDSSGPFGKGPQGLLLKMLFPLPPKPIKIGETIDVPAHMPFNAMGSMLQVTGCSHMTLARYVKIGDHTCAQFDVDTEISHLQIPAELKGDYKCSTIGNSVFYFDVASRSFVSGTIALMMQFSVDAPMPKLKIPGQETPDLPKRSKMSMVSDNLIKVNLKE